MSYLDINSGQVVANAAEHERASFMKRTYLHTGGAIVAYALVTAMIIMSGVATQFMQLLGTSSMSWLIVLGAYMFASSVANKWAHSNISREKQYMGLALYIVAFAVITSPAMLMASARGMAVFQPAILITAALVGGLTFTAFSTKINFSFMGRALTILGFVAMGTIVAAVLFNFQLGVWFMGAMVLLLAGSVLYTTSNIIHEYHPDQHVAASLALFSSVGTLFYYVVQLVMSFTNSD